MWHTSDVFRANKPLNSLYLGRGCPLLRHCWTAPIGGYGEQQSRLPVCEREDGERGACWQYVIEQQYHAGAGQEPESATARLITVDTSTTDVAKAAVEQPCASVITICGLESADVAEQLTYTEG